MDVLSSNSLPRFAVNLSQTHLGRQDKFAIKDIA